jgi:GH15 family glucan-1,4-alpha-glucosidase
VPELGGNPWVISTLAAAEYFYRLAKLSKSKTLFERGDQFLARVRYHANPDGSLSEQIDRNTGFMRSARDLSWNYGAFLTAYFRREDAIHAIPSLEHP